MMNSVYRSVAWAAGILTAFAVNGAGPVLAQDGATGIEEIIVTARRREESLQSVPVAVTAFNPDDLLARGITQLQDLGLNTPSMEVATGGFRRNTPSVIQRGIEGSGFNVTQDTSTGFYYNEVIFMRPHGQNQTLYDLESIQVLNGLQGTLFGKNTMGGAILFTYKKPTDVFEGQIDSEFGNFGRIDAHAMVNLPVSDDLAIRLNFKTANSSGYSRVLNQNNRKVDDEEAYSWRVSALWEPTEDFSTYLIYSGVRDHNNGDSQIIVPGLGGIAGANAAGQASIDLKKNPREIAGLTFELFSETDTQDVTNVTEWNVAENVLVKNIAAYRWVDTNDLSDFDGGPIDVAQSIQTEEGWQVSEELQLQGTSFDNNLTWTAGAFFIKEDIEEWSWQSIFGFLNLAKTRQGGFAENTHYALFAQGTYDLSEVLLDGLSFTGGIRQNWDTKEFLAVTYTPAAFDPPDPTFLACRITDSATNLPHGNTFDTCGVQMKESWDKLTWTFGAEYQVTDDILTYFTRRRGMRTGRLNRRAVRFPGEFFSPAGPETLTDMEFGIKADWALGDVPVRTNLALFRTKYKDRQQSLSSLQGGIILTQDFNTGRDLIKGIEAQFTVEPSDNFTISGWYSYTDGTNEIIGAEGLAGPPVLVTVNAPFFSPSHRGGITFNYVYPLSGGNDGDLSITLSANFSEDDPGGTALQPDPIINQPWRDIYNARIDWKNVMGSNLDIGIWGRNLGNELYGQASDVILGRTPHIAYEEPRTFGGSFTWRFGAAG